MNALRVWLALTLIGWADRLLPTHYEATFFALIDLVEAIVSDRLDEIADQIGNHP